MATLVSVSLIQRSRGDSFSGSQFSDGTMKQLHCTTLNIPLCSDTTLSNFPEVMLLCQPSLKGSFSDGSAGAKSLLFTDSVHSATTVRSSRTSLWRNKVRKAVSSLKPLSPLFFCSHNRGAKKRLNVISPPREHICLRHGFKLSVHEEGIEVYRGETLWFISYTRLSNPHLCLHLLFQNQPTAMCGLSFLYYCSHKRISLFLCFLKSRFLTLW